MTEQAEEEEEDHDTNVVEETDDFILTMDSNHLNFANSTAEGDILTERVLPCHKKQSPSCHMINPLSVSQSNYSSVPQ